jgi:hypothetical protein
VLHGGGGSEHGAELLSVHPAGGEGWGEILDVLPPAGPVRCDQQVELEVVHVQRSAVGEVSGYLAAALDRRPASLHELSLRQSGVGPARHPFS